MKKVLNFGEREEMAKEIFSLNYLQHVFSSTSHEFLTYKAMKNFLI